jgi:hypothetical protein
LLARASTSIATSHVVRGLSKYLFAVALSDSVEGFRDCLFEILHFDDVPNPDGFPFLNRRQISPCIEDVEMRRVQVRNVAKRFRDSFALGLHGDLGFRGMDDLP